MGAGAGPRLYVGMPSFSAAGVSAFGRIVGGSISGGSSSTGTGSSSGGTGNEETGISAFQSLGATIKEAGVGLGNLGGIMFWDGPEGELDVSGGGGGNVIGFAKEGLVG